MSRPTEEYADPMLGRSHVLTERANGGDGRELVTSGSSGNPRREKRILTQQEADGAIVSGTYGTGPYKWVDWACLPRVTTD